MPDLSLDEIVSQGLEMTKTFSRPEDYDALWDHFRQARAYGRTGLDAALRLLEGDTFERTVGCDLLSVLLDPDDEGWGHEVAVEVTGIAQGETDPDCCWSIAQALELARDPIGVPTLVELSTHADSDVRFKVACALPNCAEFDRAVDPAVVGTLLMLMEDSVAEVRDWATFGLGQQLEVDSQEIRDGLARHIDDDHDDTRSEALVGLARRRDSRALVAVRLALEAVSVSRLAVESARYLCSPELLAALVALQSWWDVDTELVKEAIEASDPDVQAGKVTILNGLFEELDSIDGLSLNAYCDRYETYVFIEVSHGGKPTLGWELDSLTARAAQGHRSVGQLILSELASNDPSL